MNYISVLVPAFNEAENIEITASSLCSIDMLNEIIVIDDGSEDDTSGRIDMIDEDKLLLLKHPVNKGKGAALNTGLEICSGNYILTVDADLKESVKEIPELLRPIIDGNADMVIASWKSAGNDKKSGFGFAQGLGFWGIRLLTGLKLESPLSGQRAFTREVIEKIGGFAEGFGVETALTIATHRAGYRILEKHLELTHDKTGMDLVGFKHRARQFVDIFKVLLKHVLYSRKVEK